jgi:hypothetical protein
MLMEDVVAPGSQIVHPGLYNILHDLQVLLHDDLKALGKDVGGMTSPSLDKTPRTITVAENFVDVTIRTSVQSKHSHQLYFLVNFLILGEVLLILKEYQLVQDSGVLQPSQQLPRLLCPPGFDHLRHKLFPPHGVKLVAEVFLHNRHTLLSPIQSSVVMDYMDLPWSAFTMLQTS